MSNTILRSNPQNVPLEHIQGMRLLSVEEADNLYKIGGLKRPDGSLFIWTICGEWSNLCDGSAGRNRTYATTTPERHYLQFKK